VGDASVQMMMQTVPGVLGKKSKGLVESGRRKKSKLRQLEKLMADMDAPWVASSTAFSAVGKEIDKIKSMLPGSKQKDRKRRQVKPEAHSLEAPAHHTTSS
jgi:deoxyribose-phosphate aldolase